LIIRRINDGVDYDLRFPKTGGGEDIDFCLKKRQWALDRNPTGSKFEGFIAAPRTTVTHPWWGGGERSYWRFYMWSKGDGALIKMYPQHTYLAAAPNSAEMLLAAGVIVVVGLAAICTSASSIFIRLGMTVAVCVVTSNIVHDLYRHIWRDADRVKTMNTTLTEVQWVAAVVESTFIRIWSEMGRVIGLLERGELLLLGRRFEWFTGRWGRAPAEDENRNSVQRFALAGMIVAFMLCSSLA
jgi:hypothetical protein